MEYFASALAALSLVSFASLFAPKGEKTRRAVLSALSLVLLFLLIPRGEFALGDLFSFEEATPPSSEEYEAVFCEGVEKGIEDDLCDRFSLEKDEIKASCTLAFGNEAITLSALSLTLSGKNAAADVTGILRYIEKSYGVHAEIHLSP